MTASALPSLSGARGAALVRADLLRARTLSVFRGVLADEIGSAFLELLDALATEEAPASVGGVYGRLFALLADEAELSAEPLVGDAWQNHLLDRLLADENAVQPQGPARRARPDRRVAAGPGRARPGGAAGALRAGRRAAGPRGRPRRQRRAAPTPGSAWDASRRSTNGGGADAAGQPRPKERLAAADGLAGAGRGAGRHYARVGAGLFGRYRAFRWAASEGQAPASRSALVGVPRRTRSAWSSWSATSASASWSSRTPSSSWPASRPTACCCTATVGPASRRPSRRC